YRWQADRGGSDGGQLMRLYRPYRLRSSRRQDRRRTRIPRGRRGSTPRYSRPRRKAAALLHPGVSQPARSRKIQRLGRHWENKDAIIRHDDGREVCNMAKFEGEYAYYERIWLFWVRQDGKCCVCKKRLRMKDATFEHQTPRTKAR